MPAEAQPPGLLLADALAREDLHLAGRVVSEHLWSLVQSDWPLLARVLEQLPESVLAAEPALALVRQFARSLFLHSGAINVEVQPPTGPAGAIELMPAMLSDMALLQELLAHRLRGDIPAALAVSVRLRERAARSDETGRRPAHGLVGFHQLQVGVTEALAGDLERALRDFTDARLLRGGDEPGLTELDALLKAAVVQAARGRLVEAERLIEETVGLPEVGEPFASQLAGTRAAARALIAVDRLAPNAAELVRDATERNADAEMWPFALLASVRWSIVTGDLVGALDEIDRATAFRSVPTDTLAAAIVVAARGQTLALMGEFGAAVATLDAGAADGLRGIELVRVRLALQLEGPEPALRAVRGLVVVAGVAPSIRAEAMLLMAWAQLRLLGAVEPGTAGAVGALIAREGLWRTLQLVPDEVVGAIPGLASAPAFPRRLVLRDPDPAARLTPNELEILRLLAGPESLPAIARARFVTVNTVKTQVASVYRRLGVHSRRDAVAEGTRRGILGSSHD